MPSTIGTRWYKCDLHLHTASSHCYTEKNDTPAQWVARAIEQGLTAVAVTDHNDYRGIADITAEGKKQGLIVFPGVEITCDTSKIHMLILFDRTKTEDTVRDFLNRCDIDSECVGTSEGTSMSVFEVCTIARKRGALIIAAHIDEFSSISGMNPANLEKLMSSGLLDAVQTANAPVWEKYSRDKDAEAMMNAIRGKYGDVASAEEAERWRKCYMRAKEAGLPMLSFSDNPHSPSESAHGLWGIGTVYTWIQMASEDLNGLRQALIADKSRIRMMFDSVERPRTEPDFWLRSLDIRHTVLNPHNSIHLDLHPQLNCIIGNRGSGKSAIVKILCGVFQQLTSGLLKNSLQLQRQHYAPAAPDEPGYFTDESEIEIRFEWYGLSYRLVVSDIRSVDEQTYHLYAVQPDGSEKPEPLSPQSFRSLLCAEVFIEGQIMETAKRDGCLMERVDRFIPDMYILQSERDYYRSRLANTAMELDTANRLLENAARVDAEQAWLEQMTQSEPDPRYPSMIARRKHAKEQHAACRMHVENLKNDRDTCLKEYEQCIAEICAARKDFLSNSIGRDESYKIEIIPQGSRSSLRRQITAVLNAPSDAIHEDLRLLEESMFGSKGGPEAFEHLLCEARSDGKDAAKFSDYFLHLIRGLDLYHFELLLVFRPEDELTVSCRPAGAKNFRPVAPTSVGQLCGAILTMILLGSLRPLVIDNPESGADNRMVYEDLVPRLKRIKQERQLILVTHSANIAVNADPDMVIVMDPKSRFTRVKLTGTIDSPEIRSELCDVLEGTHSAFEERARKYGGGI